MHEAATEPGGSIMTAKPAGLALLLGSSEMVNSSTASYMTVWPAARRLAIALSRSF